MSIADTIIERYKSGTSKEGSVADRILARFGIEDKATKKKKVVEENLALAEKYKAEAHSGIRNTVNDLFGYGADKTGFAESPVSNFLSENLKESTKDRFLQDDVDNGKIEQIKRNSALVSELLKKKRENPSKSSLYDSVLKDLQSQNAELSGSVGGELKNKTDEQLWGQAIGTSAEAAQALPFASLFTQGAKVAGKAGVLQGAKLLSKEGVINVLKNPTFQENALYGGAISGSKALKEQEGPFGVAKDTATGYLTGGTGALALNKGFSLIGRALTKLSTKFFEKIGTRPKADIDPVEVKSTVDEIVGIVDRDLKPEEEQMVMESLSRGATKEEIVTEVGKAKIEAGFDPSIRLSQVVDELEAGGKKLSLDEIATVKKGMDEGKSFEEIKNTLEPQKAPSTAPKEETGATVPKDTSDNGDEAFLKAVEERFKASKTNKFREATKDAKGRFTGSKSEKGFKAGDAERDDLSQAIQNRMDSLKEGEYKSTQENFDNESAIQRLEEIQNKIPKAKVEDLPALKKESDDITKELLDKRAKVFRPLVAKDEKVRVVGNIAKMSDTFPEFRANLKRSGYDEMKLFDDKAAAETFFNRSKGAGKAKYRVADEDPLLQEARKYKTTVNLQDKNDLDYLRRIFSEDTINDIKSGKKTDWRGDSYEDLARVNIISEAPKTVEQQLAGKIKDIKLRSDTFYHGTSSGSADSIMSSGFMPGSKLPRNAYRGGGYGKMQSTVSFAETPKEAGIFSTLTKDGKIVEAKLKPNARVVSIDGVEDAIDLEDYIGYLRKQKIDAVYIGGGEKELVVINPKAATPTKSQLTDIWKKAHGEKFRDIAPRFEELTGTKITPEQEAQIKSLHKRMFGDENVEITAQILTPEGQKAFGVYQNKVIKILDGQVDPTDTFYHEAVHKYLDLFTTIDEQKNIYLEARKLWKTDNLDELEEKIAENFIRYAKENESVVGTMKVLFDKVIDRIKNALNGESSIEALYKDILEGKAKKAPLTSKELQKRTTDLQRSAREKEREMAVIRKGYMSEEKFLAEPQDLIFDEDVKGQYESFVGLLRRFRTGRQREAILSGDVGSIKKALDGKVGAREIDDIFYSQEKSDDEMLDYFRGIFEKGKKKVTEQEILSSVESKLKTDPDYIRLQDELGDIRKQQENLARDEEASIKSVNESLDEVKKEVEPIQKTKEATLDNSVKQIVPKEKKVSLIASRLNKDLPPDFRIDETYDPKAINKEADRAAELIAENKTKAIQKALDTGTNPMERDAILIELSEIAKRDKDYGTLNDLFNKRSELIRSGAQSLNMEKASILLNPQEQYMRNVVNAKLGKVKISGKDLTPETLAAKRTGIRKETKDVVRRSFKIEDAQELFDKLLCK